MEKDSRSPASNGNLWQAVLQVPNLDGSPVLAGAPRDYKEAIREIDRIFSLPEAREKVLEEMRDEDYRLSSELEDVQVRRTLLVRKGSGRVHERGRHP